jgi:hypothetical protein
LVLDVEVLTLDVEAFVEEDDAGLVLDDPATELDELGGDPPPERVPENVLLMGPTRILE